RIDPKPLYELLKCLKSWPNVNKITQPDPLQTQRTWFNAVSQCETRLKEHENEEKLNDSTCFAPETRNEMFRIGSQI
ncbi:MAG: hypothetical protein KA293_12310, partial [Bacteroidia bacterium]|nr:hypothetical protein [Bacteroidia bacterium]